MNWIRLSLAHHRCHSENFQQINFHEKKINRNIIGK